MKQLITLFVLLIFLAPANAQLNLQWQEMGPDNFGGIVNGAIFDKRDSTRQTLYAACSGAGVWKTTNGGQWWFHLTCENNFSATTIAQAIDGTIYIGTGDLIEQAWNSNTSDSHAGSGVYKIDAQDNIISLSSTVPNNNNSAWRAIGQIAVNPRNANQLIAANLGGLYESLDAGNSWDTVHILGMPPAQALNIEWGNDGQTIFAVVGSYKLVRSIDAGATWSLISNLQNPVFPSTSGRIAIAIAPSNPSIAYANIANLGGSFQGLYITKDKGNTWDTLAEFNRNLFPFSYGQGWFDNTIAVSPIDSSKIYFGGANMYTYSPSTGFNKVPPFEDVHRDSTHLFEQFQYLINDLNPEEFYIAGLQGIYHAADAISQFTSPHFSFRSYGMGARDFYSIAANRAGDVMGGSSEYGLVINQPGSKDFLSYFNNYKPHCEFSGIDTSYKFTNQTGYMLTRNFNQGNFWQVFSDSILFRYISTYNSGPCANPQYDPITSPFWLFETKQAWRTRDSTQFIATVNYNAGDTIIVTSNVANATFKMRLQQPLNIGEQITLPDPIKSRIVLSTDCGTYMTIDALNTTPLTRWFLLENNLGGVPVSACSTNDGNSVYLGTSQGAIIRLSNLNLINYDSIYGTRLPVIDSPSNLLVKHISPSSISGLCVDPNNDSIIVATIESPYNPTTTNCYKSIDAGNTWSAIQIGSTGLTAYTCVIDANNSNTYIAGTEQGIWSSTDAGLNWHQDNALMCEVPVYVLRQQPLLEDHCMVLYAATNSRGLWRSFTLTPAGCNTSVNIKELAKASEFDFVLYPNPTSTRVTVRLQLENPQTLDITLSDISGRIITRTEKQVQSGVQQLDLSVANLSAGSYLVSLNSPGYSRTKLLIVE